MSSPTHVLKGTFCILIFTLLTFLGTNSSHAAPSPVSGAESFSRTDLSIGKLFPITLNRRYSSNTGYDSPLGYGWAHNYDKRLYIYADGSVIIRKETGWKRKFSVRGTGYATPVGETGILVKNPDGTFTYTEKDGTSELYDLKGRLVTITAPSGSSLSLTYVAATRASIIGLLPANIDQGTPREVARDYLLSKIEEKNPLGALTGTSLTFTYNTGTGRLTGVSDNLGRTVAYSHDTIGNLTGVTTSLLGSTYPSGRVITYSYSDNKTVSVQNSTTNLASNITYKPFGGITGLTYGNALSGTIGYDSQYRVSSITAGTIMNLTYADDANGNITTITNNLDATRNKTFTYDNLDRLATANGSWGSLSWTYDGTGNRKTENATTYTYQANTNKLTSANGKAFGYDNNGNTTTENARQYTYNQNQRLIQVVDGSMTAGYTYNGNGQRVKKLVNGVTTLFHYNQSGQIIAESSSAGVTTAEYVYLNGQPLAKIEGANTYYYHNDHLGTPQRLTDSTGAVVWSADYKPFGEATITGTVTNNLRFPGQYYDAETGLHYNYYRDYNPLIGRYVEADPIGLEGGLNLFAYTWNNPITNYDNNGLRTIPTIPPPPKPPIDIPKPPGLGCRAMFEACLLMCIQRCPGGVAGKVGCGVLCTSVFIACLFRPG